MLNYMMNHCVKRSQWDKPAASTSIKEVNRNHLYYREIARLTHPIPRLHKNFRFICSLSHSGKAELSCCSYSLSQRYDLGRGGLGLGKDVAGRFSSEIRIYSFTRHLFSLYYVPCTYVIVLGSNSKQNNHKLLLWWNTHFEGQTISYQ